MNFPRFPLVALFASISIGRALADSADDALNQFYTENMVSRLISETPAVVSQSPHPTHKGEKTNKGKIQQSGEASNSRGQTPAADANSLFTYRRSAAVTSKVRAESLAHIDENPDASSKSLMQKDLDNMDSVEERFDARFYRYGFSSRNVSDTYTGVLISFWEIVNNQDASTHPNGIMQIRSQMSKVLAPKLVGKSDAWKQHESESLKLMVVVLLDKLDTRKANNNSAGVDRVRNVVYQLGLNTIKVDFKKLQITDSGFKPI